MTKEYSYDYAQWLESTLFDVLASSKNTLSEKIIKKLETKGINCHEKFIEYIDRTNAKNKLIAKLPLLDTYPIDLFADNIYEDDIEKINEWEIKILTKLTMKLEKQYKSIAPDIYLKFFNKEIKPYKEYFLDETYEKILPKNMEKYWSRRIDRNIPWGESAYSNIEIDTISPFEDEYLKIETDIYSYIYKMLLNMEPKEY